MTPHAHNPLGTSVCCGIGRHKQVLSMIKSNARSATASSPHSPRQCLVLTLAAPVHISSGLLEVYGRLLTSSRCEHLTAVLGTGTASGQT